MATADPAVVRELDRLEASLAGFVRGELSQVAYEFNRAVRDSTELTAAIFSVSSIRGMWRTRVPGIMRRVLGVAQSSVDHLARATGIRRLPPGWSDLSSPSRLPDELRTWADEVNRRLIQVGDTMAEEAMRELAEGLNAGEDQAQLEVRLVRAFDRNSHLMGAARADRISSTETVSAWNAAALGFARAATATGISFTKQWVTRRDDKVREAHRDVAGQSKPIGEPFHVAGVAMQYPGDPTAPAALVINCRCVLRIDRSTVAAGVADTLAPMTDDAERVANEMFDAEVAELQSRMPPQLKEYWLAGPGAAKIRWGTPGAFKRCVRALHGKFPQETEGLCANLYHEATGRWPGQHHGAEVVDMNANGVVHTGAMLALLPSTDDAARLALDGGEAADQLHVTLAYLGEADDWSDDDRNALIARMAVVAARTAPLNANVFGASQWNPASDSPSWVWNVGDGPDGGSGLTSVHGDVSDQLGGFDIPRQHSPWVAHMCAMYGAEGDLSKLTDRVGPVALDRLAVAFGGEWTVFSLNGPNAQDTKEMADQMADPTYMNDPEGAIAYNPVGWGAAGTSVLAYENQQTGDGRAFAPGAIQWDDRPKPLMYCEETGEGHEGAKLAGAIFTVAREGDVILGTGVLYPSTDAGSEAVQLLAEGAPLGVSVDLDDVSFTVVDMGGNNAEGVPLNPDDSYTGHLITASVLMSPDGGYTLTGETASEWTASGLSLAGESSKVVFHVSADGMVPAAAFTAAAGDPATGGTDLQQQRSGDYLMRITSARLRGATLVPIPAFAGARIVLDGSGNGYVLAAAGQDAGDTSGYDKVVAYVRKSSIPVTASDAAHAMKMSVAAVKRHMAAAAQKGYIVRIARGTYIRSETQPVENLYAVRRTASGEDIEGLDVLTAASTGSVDLPVASRDHAWDGAGAERRMFDAANGDWSQYAKGFAWKDDRADPETKGAYHLPYADIVDGRLTIIPRGVFAAQAALNGARGGTSIPADQKGAVSSKLEKVRVHVEESTGGSQRNQMEASAWSAMKDLPPMPADWFREPTREELATDMGGVHYANGRIFGWVARAGEPHAGFAKKITIESLGRIDTTHFLRQRFTLDDGSTVRAGALTMNTGHHRDGAECETSACAFDDTRTVAGIVTVGMNERGMWFSGAAHPTLSEWDRRVFMACEPSYHLRKGSNGAWQLRGVLTVPVPGHSTPMVASLAASVVERNNLALTAAAQQAEVEEAISAAIKVAPVEAAQTDPFSPDATVAALDYDRLADALVAAMGRADQRKRDDAAELEALLAEAGELMASGYDDTDIENHPLGGETGKEGN